MMIIFGMVLIYFSVLGTKRTENDLNPKLLSQGVISLGFIIGTVFIIIGIIQIF